MNKLKALYEKIKNNYKNWQLKWKETFKYWARRKEIVYPLAIVIFFGAVAFPYEAFIKQNILPYFLKAQKEELIRIQKNLNNISPLKVEEQKKETVFSTINNDPDKIKLIYIGINQDNKDLATITLEKIDGQKVIFKDAPQWVLNLFLQEIKSKLNLEKIKINIDREEIIRDITVQNDLMNFKHENVSSIFWDNLKRNSVNLFKVLIALVPLVFFAYLVMMIAAQFGIFSKDFEVIKPKDIEGSIDDLVGMEDIKKEVLQLEDIFNERYKYAQHGIHHGFNIMFTGPAGVGKTKLAQMLAKKLNIPIIAGSAASLENGFVAGGVTKLKSLYRKAAKLNKCIIFLDEAEILLKKRGRISLSKFEDDTTNAFLALLDGVSTKNQAEVIWIVATNFDDANTEMDPAVMRRFQTKINFRLPNREERLAILQFYINKKESSLIDQDLNLEPIADVTSKMSPALLKNITDTASMMAINENSLINNNLLYRAFERNVLGLTDRKTTENLTQERKIIAIHELGHFFLHLESAKEKLFGNKELVNLTREETSQLKEKINVLKISTESISKSGALGFVLSKPEDKFIESRNDLEWRVRMLYGGVANETIFMGEDKVTTGAHNDIGEITKILKVMVVDLGMYSSSKVNFSVLNQAASEENKKEIEAKAEILFSETIKILEKYKNLTEILVPRLLERYSMNLNEMFYELRIAMAKLEKNN